MQPLTPITGEWSSTNDRGYREPTPNPTPRKHGHPHQRPRPPNGVERHQNLRRQGFRVFQFTQRDLRVRAEAYLEAHRAQLVEDAKADVERWRLAGFFGRRRSNIKTSAKEAKA